MLQGSLQESLQASYRQVRGKIQGSYREIFSYVKKEPNATLLPLSTYGQVIGKFIREVTGKLWARYREVRGKFTAKFSVT